MTNDSFKRLEKIIDSIKEIVEITQGKVEKLELFQSVMSGQIRTIKDQQSVINKKLDNIGEIREERLLSSSEMPKL